LTTAITTATATATTTSITTTATTTIAGAESSANHVGTQWVNTGGWVGTYRAAKAALKELRAMTNKHQGSRCYLGGTDQLLGNILYLRHHHHIATTSSSSDGESSGDGGSSSSSSNSSGAIMSVGLDVDSQVFASSPQFSPFLKLMKTAPPQSSSSSVSSSSQSTYDAFCRTPDNCPAFLHFNGGANTNGMEYSLVGSWSTEEHQQCAAGKLTLVDVDRGTVQEGAAIEGCTTKLPAC
jgi:hypothetical protein